MFWLLYSCWNWLSGEASAANMLAPGQSAQFSFSPEDFTFLTPLAGAGGMTFKRNWCAAACLTFCAGKWRSDRVVRGGSNKGSLQMLKSSFLKAVAATALTVSTWASAHAVDLQFYFPVAVGGSAAQTGSEQKDEGATICTAAELCQRYQFRITSAVG
jgi:hypothetical protein